MACGQVFRCAGQGLFVGFQCLLVVTCHGQRSAMIEMVLRVIWLGIQQCFIGLRSGLVVTRLIVGPGPPLRIFK